MVEMRVRRRVWYRMVSSRYSERESYITGRSTHSEAIKATLKLASSGMPTLLAELGSKVPKRLVKASWSMIEPVVGVVKGVVACLVGWKTSAIHLDWPLMTVT
jgi:hypothetical protein